MSLKKLGAQLSRVAPTVAGLLGGRAAEAVAERLAGLFGGKSDARSLAAAINADPNAAARIRELDAELQTQLIQATTAQHLAVNETMRVEVQADGWFKSGWRPFTGWILGCSFGGISGAMIHAVIRDPALVADPNFTGLLTWLFIAMAAVVGINIRERSKSKGVP